MVLAADEQIRLGLVPPAPKEREIDPKTRVTKLAVLDHGIYRRRLTLSEADLMKVKKALKDACQEWKQNTALLHNKLRRYQDRMEGITGPKDFPWPNASNLSIPMTEIHVVSLHSVVRSTILDNDPIWSVKEMIPSEIEGERVDPNIEWFLNFVTKKQLKLDGILSDCYMDAFAKPASVGVLDWVEEIGKEYHIEAFDTADEFLARFPDQATSGMSMQTYESFLADLMAGRQAQVKIEEYVVKYRGPHARVVDLKDLVLAPVTAPSLEYTVFHGDQFRQRADWFRVRANQKWFDKAEVKKMLEHGGKQQAIDDISEQADRIEGLSSSRVMKPDEYDCVRGNLRIALGEYDENTGTFPEEAMYHVVYNPDTDTLLRIEEFPYWHNRVNYIVFRIRRRTNRLMGRCVPDMLYDSNEEVNTQHNQRIDSRTITTVPTFIKQANETQIDFSRKNQQFFPGQCWTLSNMTNLQQLKVTQTDLGTTMQEESNLFQIAEWLTGASPSLRAGTPQIKDPRGPAKKAAMAIQQSNVRIDDYIKELTPPTNEFGSQVLELYYQFAPAMVLKYGRYDQAAQKWIASEIKRTSLRNRNMSVDVSRTSITDNPDMVMQRALVDYQIWSKEPMIGQNLVRRHELVRRTLFAERQKDISKLLPNIEQMLQEIAGQQGLSQPGSPLEGFMNSINGKTGAEKEGDDGNDNLGMRQGGPDTSIGSLGNKPKETNVGTP